MPKYKLSCSPVFTFSLPGWDVRIPATVSCVTAPDCYVCSWTPSKDERKSVQIFQEVAQLSANMEWVLLGTGVHNLRSSIKFYVVVHM